jgi:nucleotide-binding universal stress UspA family protein
MKILVAADGSPYTKRMLAYLAAHDEWLGGAPRVHGAAHGARRAGHAAAVLDKHVLQEYYEDEARRSSSRSAPSSSKQGLEATFVSKVGPAADTIATLAEKGKFDLLVMGSHGQGSLTGLVMGSVATKVLASCSTPVLLVR